MSLVNTLSEIIIRYSDWPADHLRPENTAAVKSRLEKSLKADDGILALVLPAFPFKSANHTAKVLGAEPDFGDYTALKTLSDLCNELNEHVQTRLMIVSDGHVFNDLFRISDQEVDNYFGPTTNIVPIASY